ncbi:Putative rhamnosyl transferase [Algoriphagus faecimaris]|uniref:Putative rhamnosyl transferase n=1 Tax=Algoriphagus faecimaris TaxID=686796 RepID=A0A1G6PTU8_9BACT|nr:glycosyltransferase [Algoriphagus faecimaris]SDC83094.1 Putative rhamnosyl transferase [Algoriphagus faecimaris]
MNFKHFLFTRFNVQYLEMVPYNLGMDPDVWLEGRIELFFDFCYPSVKNQTCKDFQWIVFFDTRTPSHFLDSIAAQDTDGIIAFHYTDHWKKLNGEILQIMNREKNQYDSFISTRIDGDDAVSGDFICSIQSEVMKLKTETPFAINCSNGVILDTQLGIFYQKKILSNAFISLVQNSASLNTSIFKVEHQTISREIKTIELEEPKMWLQVVHGGNLINKTSGLPLTKNIGQHFNISLEINDANPKSGNLLKAYLKYLRIRVNNLKIKVNRVFGK